jgi:glycosyltransferase involved in cell wall biosynthesis
MLLANREGSVGGAQRQAWLLAGELSRRGWRVIVVNQASRVTRPGADPDDDVERVALPVLPGVTRWSFLLSFLLWATANRRRFDVIHAHSTSAGLTAGVVGRLVHRPVIVKVTGMHVVTGLGDRGLARRLRRWLLDRTTDVLVAVSREMMHELSRAGVAATRRVLIPNGVQLPPAPGAGTGSVPERGRGVGGPVVLYVGRLENIKGVRRLLPMWAAMPRHETASLVIVGDGSLRAELEREAVARGVHRTVHFLGSQPDVAAFYAGAEVFVLPSASEGLSNALLEAMAARLPVVVSDIPGNREVVDDGVNGFLVDWSEPGAAAAQVGRLLDDAPLRRRIGAAASRRARGFAIAAVADRYGELYRTVASPRGGGREEVA